MVLTESGMDFDYCKSNSCPFQEEAHDGNLRPASGLRNVDPCSSSCNKGVFGNLESKHGSNN